MKLYLLRHAEAVSHAATDCERDLTAKGEEQAERVGHFCKKNGICPDILVTSPYTRARRTAEAVGSVLDISVTVSERLESGMTPTDGLAYLKELSAFENVMLVGHEPDISSFAAFLMGIKGDGRIHVSKASLTGLYLPVPVPGTATLEFLIRVKWM